MEGQIIAGRGEASNKRVQYTLILLMLVNMLNIIDRQIVTILAEPLRKDLSLSDTELGLLTGLAFALFYAVAGIPIARYADRTSTSRVRLIALSISTWSIMTALCGAAQNFWQLFAARVGVGVGEAGCTPAAHSLISDIVPREKRASAIGFFGIGAPIGVLLGLILGGQIADAFGWRSAFLVVGIPGVLFAILIWLTVPEPDRRARATPTESGETPAETSFNSAWNEVRKSRAFLYLMVATATAAFLGYGKVLWTTVFFIRSHGLTAGETGLWFGLAYGVAGIVGMWAGGYIADKFGSRDMRYYLVAPAVAMALSVPLLLIGYNMSDWTIALLLLFPTMIANLLYYGPAFACVQSLVSAKSRAFAVAVLLLAQSLIGLGLGPLLFGIFSDLLKPIVGEESVRWVLYGAAVFGLVPAFFFWLTSRRLVSDMRSD